MWIKRQIPNLFTLGNLTCGMLGIYIVLGSGRVLWPLDPPVMIAVLLSLAMVCDWLDGFMARILKVSNPLGKELDSLADMVTFGVLPGFMAFAMIQQGVLRMATLSGGNAQGFHTTILPFYLSILPYAGFLIALFSALRLAKFNVDERKGDSFYGLPTPANALFFLSIFLIFFLDRPVGNFWAVLVHPYTVAALSVLFSIFLISDFRLLTLKFKEYSWKNNYLRYLLLIISATGLLILFYKAVPLIILLYFILSFIDNRIHNHEIPG